MGIEQHMDGFLKTHAVFGNVAPMLSFIVLYLHYKSIDNRGSLYTLPRLASSVVNASINMLD